MVDLCEMFEKVGCDELMFEVKCFWELLSEEEFGVISDVVVNEKVSFVDCVVVV